MVLFWLSHLHADGQTCLGNASPRGSLTPVLVALAQAQGGETWPRTSGPAQTALLALHMCLARPDSDTTKTTQ